MPTANEVLKLKQEAEQANRQLATVEGQIKQLKGSDRSNLEELKERLVKLESERVELDQQFQKKLSVYRSAYNEYFAPP